ncbi:hypothetical protein ACWDZW_29915, partial [Streptomyces coeruleorubidus]
MSRDTGGLGDLAGAAARLGLRAFGRVGCGLGGRGGLARATGLGLGGLGMLTCNDHNDSVAAAKCARRAAKENVVAVVGSY